MTINQYSDLGFGVLSMFNFNFYADESIGLPAGFSDPFPSCRYLPVYNDLNDRWEYVFQYPELIRPFVAYAHSLGLKVTSYFYPAEWERITGTSLQDAILWMREFQAEYDLDGWYLDGAGSNQPNWLEAYEFVRQLRMGVGDDGHLWFHVSADPWGRWDGRVLVHAECYADMTLKGETGDLVLTHSPNNPCYRYYTGGYGTSQAMAVHMPMFGGFGRGSLREEERSRLMGTLFAT